MFFNYHHILNRILTFFILISFPSLSQTLFYQNAFKGGVAADGRSYLGLWYNLADTVNFAQVVPAGSSIKKSWLFTRRLIISSNYPATVNNPIRVNFNGDTITFDSSSVITPLSNCDNSANSAHNWLCVKDVTVFTQNSNNKLIIPCQACGSQYAPFVYIGFFLVIIYEDPTMPVTNVAIFLNANTFASNMTHNLNNLNPINTAFDVGLSICDDNVYYKGDSVTYTLQPGNHYLGTIGETQGSGNAGGLLLPGSFYFQNNTLFGLRDDSPNPFIDTTDALANIKTYLSNNATNFNLITTMKTTSGCLNAINSHILSYNTPCPFRTMVPQLSYTMCSGNGLQLSVSNPQSGNIYSWFPGNGLSDSSIANPIANPIVGTTNYIVQIDSAGCKHTEHFTVSVYPSPKFDSLNVANAICADNRGAITISQAHSGNSPYLYNIGSANQSSNYFSGINPGTYTATVIDGKGCTYKKPFIITEVNPAIAAFTFSPDTGCVNEIVNFTSNSIGVTNVNWFCNNILFSTGLYSSAFTFTNTVAYTITLIGWHNQSQCSDTITKTIYVKECPPDSFVTIIPNIFTPNGDGINDTWQLTIYNFQYTINNFELTIYDRWGLEIFETTNLKQGWDGHSTSGIICSEGTYYYVAKYKATGNTKGEVKQKELKGYLQLSR